MVGGLCAAGRRAVAGRRAGLAKRRQLSHRGGRTAHRRSATADLSADRAGLDHPSANADRTGGRGRGRHWRLCQAVPGRARSGPAHRLRPVLQPGRRRDRGKQCEPRRELHRAQWRGLCRARERPGRAPRRNREHRRRHPHGRAGPRQGRGAGRGRARAQDRQRQRQRARSGARHRADAGRRQQPHGCGRSRRQDQRDQPHSASGDPGANRAQPHRGSWMRRCAR